jgi:hypothetical protein
MSEDKETVATQGFILACMNCHNGKGEAVDTMEEAQRRASIHLSIGGGHKDHSGHTVTITPTTIVRRKK